MLKLMEGVLCYGCFGNTTWNTTAVPELLATYLEEFDVTSPYLPHS